MDELPSGVVTFVFTDIEGSTRLLQFLGDDAYGEALSAHHRILRQAIAAHDGIEFGSEGDAFFVAFARSADAIAAVIDAQIALARHPWPQGAVFRVRMGVHSGPVRVQGDNYVGLAVHEAARIATAAHGGQVVVSSEAKESVGDLGGAITLQSLGRHRLKDLGAPIELHQLCHDDLETSFPPLRSLESVSHNLPIQPSSFLGRTDELIAGEKQLRTCRLLTLTGPGGTGKTRLAFQLAATCLDSFPDGVWVAELADLSDPAFVPAALASALGLHDEAGRTTTETVVEHLRGCQALVVLDNCEHVVDAAAQLADALLRRCEDVRVLATTREPLHTAGETVWAIGPLGLPDDADRSVAALASADAVRLFCERATEAAAGFSLTSANADGVAEICARLDGMPLALELAAAWVPSLSPAQIAERLGESMNLLTKGTRGAHGRQASLRGAIAWSHELLAEDERTLFARLSVFIGGWTLAAAEEVCVGEPLNSDQIVRLLDALVDKSLVVATDDGTGTARYRFLETIHAYAAEKLDDGAGTVAVANRHVAWCKQLARRGAEAANGGVEQARAFDALAADHANLLAALEVLCNAQRFAEAAALALDLRGFWALRGHWRLSQAELGRCLVRDTLDPALEGALREGMGSAAFALGDYREARVRFDEALAIAQTLGDRQLEGACVGDLGNVAWALGEYEEARDRYEQALVIAREMGDLTLEGRWGGNVGAVALELADYAEARACFGKALDIARRLGNRKSEGLRLGGLGNVALAMGDLSDAGARFVEALAIAREVGDRQWECLWVGSLGEVALARGDHADAEARCHEALAIARDHGDRKWEGYWIGNLGAIALARGDHRDAGRCFDDALAIARELGDRRSEGSWVAGLASVALAVGDHRGARSFLREALAIEHALGTERVELLEDCARLLGAAGDFAGSARLLAAADELCRQRAVHRAVLRERQYLAAVDVCRAELGVDGFTEIWSQGVDLTWPQAVATALELTNAGV
jgi:predicted ATPase/class 3 adenylate cyclase/Tfp pilus assembly protein PilF